MTELSPRVLHVLTAARAAERTARGPERRDAFRVTRFLIAGCLAAGISAEELADALGVTPHSVRNRGGADGLVPSVVFAAHARIDLGTLTTWQHLGHLPAAEPDRDHRTSYPASALIAALLTNPPTCPEHPTRSTASRRIARPDHDREAS